MNRYRAKGFAFPAIAIAGAVAACAGSSAQPVVSEVLFDDGGAAFDAGSPIQPTLGSTVVAQKAPPPISGGTLLVTKDGKYAVAADSDRDVVYVVNLGTQTVQTVTLMSGDEPGRLAEDGAGVVHVALRGSGSIVTIDPASGTAKGRQSVCPAPRGVAWDDTAKLVWVACATGELVGLPSGGGPATKSHVVERDLRDVLVSGGALSVTQFRSANVLRLASDGTVIRHDTLPAATVPAGSGFIPQVLWRAVPGAGGIIATVHEEESQTLVQTVVQGGYGGGGGCGPLGISSSGGGPIPSPPAPFPGMFGAFDASPALDLDAGLGDDADVASDASDAGVAADTGASDAGSAFVESVAQCFAADGGEPQGFFTMGGGCPSSSIVHSAITVIDSAGSLVFNSTFPGAVPVDIALSGDGAHVATVAPGNTFGPQLPTVFEFGTCDHSTEISQALGTSEPVAVAFDRTNRVLVQTREPAELWFLPSTGSSSYLSLSKVSRKDTGHDIFHVQAGGMIACASCHPEGGDDGHVWNLDGSSRRTPSLRGTIAGTAPYHWPGDMKDLPTLFDDVYTVRMDGAKLANDQVAVLKRWVEAVPAPPAPSWVDSAAATRGKAVFERASVGCASCHSGAKLTNNTTVNVGTGGKFQVPPLVGLGWRAPFLHDGCASTLGDRFGACATAGHGNTASLATGDLFDIVAYLETL
jgi:DNA-binding beta-propeller fold protein YncE/cytochrome c553